MSLREKEAYLGFLRGLKPEGHCVEWPWYISQQTGYGRAHFDVQYGNIFLAGREVNAHRWVYEHLFGVRDPDSDICHSCDNRRCVRPGHLWEGTRLQNMQDASRKGRIWRGAKGGPGGENHQPAKIKDAQIPQIHEMRYSGAKLKAIAKEFGISRRQVGRILSGEQRALREVG